MILRWCIVLSLLAAVDPSPAADLSAALETANLRLRKDAPIPIEIRFQNSTPRLLEGRLEFTLLLGDRKSGVHRTAEIVIRPGTQTIPVLLPPPPEAHPGDGIAARMRWLGADGKRDLGDQQIGIYGIGADVVLGIVRTERRLTELDHARDASLALESLRPPLEATSWLTFTTHQAPIATGSLPAHPAGLCPYDAVFLEGKAFAAANEKQLTALARWVEAGGSAGICADAALEERHANFLNRLAVAAHPQVTFALDPNGAVGISGAPANVPVLLRPGLGRAFVTLDAGSAARDFDRNSWHAAVAWLWKLRESEQREVARTGRWSKDFLRSGQGWRGPDELELSSLWSAAAGFNALTPGAPRQMPLGVVALVLGALLVVAGPADWLVLGWMRRRRWTWFVFPLSCAAFAWLTAHLAGGYLGIEDRSGRVRIVELADDGRPVREVRYEMILPARDRDWSFDLRDSVAVPVSRVQTRLPSSAPADLKADALTDAGGISEWPAPGHFILRRTLRQWAPAMVRITTFPDAKDESQPDWNSALQYFRNTPDVERWQPDDAATGGFTFEIPKRDGSEERYRNFNTVRIRAGMQLEPDIDEDSFVRWVAFGTNRRILGGLGAAVSPVIAGTSDLIQTREDLRNHRVLCAWRRVDGELLIYRRGFPAK
jgi:hypothetical protein